MTLKVLDLFAGEGGASAGYLDAGFELVAAIDADKNALKYHPRKDVAVCCDWLEGLEAFGADADLIHASPPCQRYSIGTKEACRANWPDLVGPVRAALLATGKPFVIENVLAAPLENPVILSGCMFGLTVDWDIPKTKVLPHRKLGYGTWEVVKGKFWAAGPVADGPVRFHLERQRGFEVHGFDLPVLPVDPEIHKFPALSVVTGTPSGFWDQWYAQSIPRQVKVELMRTPWMTIRGNAESIPPVYTEYIGKQFTASRS